MRESGIFQAIAQLLLLSSRKSRWRHVVSYLATKHRAKQHHRLEDKLADLRSRGFIAFSLASLQPDEVKNNCDLEIVLASDEKSLSMF